MRSRAAEQSVAAAEAQAEGLPQNHIDDREAQRQFYSKDYWECQGYEMGLGELSLTRQDLFYSGTMWHQQQESN